MKNYLKNLNSKNGIWIPIIVFLGALFTPSPIERSVYADWLSQTIATIYGLVLISTIFLYGVLIGKGVEPEK